MKTIYHRIPNGIVITPEYSGVIYGITDVIIKCETESEINQAIESTKDSDVFLILIVKRELLEKIYCRDCLEVIYTKYKNIQKITDKEDKEFIKRYIGLLYKNKKTLRIIEDKVLNKIYYTIKELEYPSKVTEDLVLFQCLIVCLFLFPLSHILEDFINLNSPDNHYSLLREWLGLNIFCTNNCIGVKSELPLSTHTSLEPISPEEIREQFLFSINHSVSQTSYNTIQDLLSKIEILDVFRDKIINGLTHFNFIYDNETNSTHLTPMYNFISTGFRILSNYFNIVFKFTEEDYRNFYSSPDEWIKTITKNLHILQQISEILTKEHDES